jgi:N-acetylneuraminate synthase
VAEVAQAHDGSLALAHAYVDAIAEAGADAVKFQTHVAAAESTPAEPWRVPFSRQDATRYDYWKRMQFGEEQWGGLRRHAAERGLLFASSPFSVAAFELLRRVGVAFWKIPSGEASNPNLLERVAVDGLPVLLSTGMSALAEIDSAVATLKRAGARFGVLQCTSAYPCPFERVGLNLLAVYRDRYHCPVGLSDHSGTIFPGLAAVTLGAESVEVHVTLDRRMPGPDAPASVTPAELRRLVDGVRAIERMCANPVDKDTAAEELSALRAIFTQSVVARRALAAGTVLAADDLITKKPGTGIPARRLPDLVGRRVRRALEADDLVRESDLEPLA